MTMSNSNSQRRRLGYFFSLTRVMYFSAMALPLYPAWITEKHFIVQLNLILILLRTIFNNNKKNLTFVNFVAFEGLIWTSSGVAMCPVQIIMACYDRTITSTNHKQGKLIKQCLRILTTHLFVTVKVSDEIYLSIRLTLLDKSLLNANFFYVRFIFQQQAVVNIFVLAYKAVSSPLPI